MIGCKILNFLDPEGYGIFWIIIEKLAHAAIVENSEDSFVWSVDNWANHCRCAKSTFRKVVSFCEHIGIWKTEEYGTTFRIKFITFEPIEIDCLEDNKKWLD